MKDEQEANSPASFSSFRFHPSSFSYYPSLPAPIPLRLVEMPEHACPYLPGRVARSRGFWAEKLPGDLYPQFMDAAFRRSGRVLYQPTCNGCRQCVPIRVPVGRFQPSTSQRRAWRKNQDLVVSAGPPTLTDETFALYQKYIAGWHGTPSPETRDGLEAFLYQSPVDSLEMRYRDPAGRLLAVGICDLSATTLSSVYFFFDPDHARRGLGTFGVLFELDWALRHGIAYYYLGYWVEGCDAMRYKALFRPSEVLGTDGVWRPNEPGK